MKPNTKNLIKYSLLFLIIAFGIFLRIYSIDPVLTLNTSGYFYHRANYLVEEGSYINLDTKNTYGSAYKENYPPFFILASVAFFKISQSNNLLAFISYYPVLVYLFIVLLGYFTLTRVYGGNTGLIFSMLFSVIPVAINATLTGRYTEEATGIFLIIGAIYSLTKLDKKINYLIFGIIFLTAYILTWQTFVIFFTGIIALAFFSYGNRTFLKRLALMAIVSIIMAYVVVGLLGIAYTPHKIVKETFLSFISNKSLDYKVALDRNDLIRTDLEGFFDQYSYFSIFLVLGLLVSIKNFREIKYKSILIFSLLGIFSVAYFLKLRFFALPFIVILSSIGINYILEPKKIDKRLISVFVVIALLLMLPLLLDFKHEIQVPSCNVDFYLPDSNPKIGYPYAISMLIQNDGGNPFCDRNFSSSLHSFGGIHIEVENARILEKMISAQSGRSSISDRDPENNISWFEAKFDCLEPSKTANLTIEILPTNENVRINYRCWMPDECELGPPQSITEPYSASWRNENCIKRNPIEGEYCKVDVYAGYPELQKYYCDKYAFNTLS